MQQMLITDGTHREDLFEKLKRACEAGVNTIQIREKTMEAQVLYELTARLVPIAAAHQVTLIVNDRIDIAIAAKADGVHLPEEGLSPAIAKQLNSFLIVGCSVHSLEKALEKEAEGADYLVFGPVFPTTCKCCVMPQGIANLALVASSVKIPVIAIGGIGSSQIPSCIEAGAKGIAGISYYWNSPEIETGILANAKALSHTRQPVHS